MFCAIPSPPANASETLSGLVSTDAQTFEGAKTFADSISAANLTGTNTGNVSLAAAGSTPNTSGASLAGQVLTLQPADETNPGIVTAGAQTLGGAKTFAAAVRENAGKQVKTAALATTTTLDSSHHVVFVNASGGAVVINLPAAASHVGRKFSVKKVDASINTVTVDGAGAETIDGAATQVLVVQYASLTVVCDGSGWFII